jgi:hypothetical protein
MVRGPHGLPVHRLQVALAAHVPQLLPVRVIGQRDHHLRARAQELPVQLAHCVGKVQHHLWHERPGLDVAPAFQLEDVTLGAEHGAGAQAFRKRSSHDATPVTGALPANRAGVKRPMS